jgi:N-acetylneuraminate synthase
VRHDTSFRIGTRIISNYAPTYFIADIGANHDGDLDRAKKLIRQAADAGADCAKFQHFKADSIVSQGGFDGLSIAHQSGWSKTVYEVYEEYSINRDWDEDLAATAQDCEIDFMSTPYDEEAVESLFPWVQAYKIGSGDITHLTLIDKVAGKGLPVFLATGASTMLEVEVAVAQVLDWTAMLCLMQCNTNYSGDTGNFSYVNLNVLRSYALHWPGMPLGLSDHTPGAAAVLGAVALGARVIEKHFTDDCTRKGPDHAFAMQPVNWAGMVEDVRRLESALGDGVKRIEPNEVESRIVQRRALRVREDLEEGAVLKAEHLEALRPCPYGAMTPADIGKVIGSEVRRSIKKGAVITPLDIN